MPELEHLVHWAGRNNLELNLLKTLQMMVDFLSRHDASGVDSVPVIQAVPCTSLIVCFASPSEPDRSREKRAVGTTERIVDAKPPCIQDLFTSRVRKWVANITVDQTNP